uniref:Uncharacterized protein n=1 Tax=feces metagenome TaxID=1861841 RepID=A0A7M2QM07_9ZZZZ
MSKFMNAAEINKAIASIATRGKKLDADIQTAGVSILNHADQHGDSTLADKLVQALPKGSRKLALVEWMLAFGKLRLLDKAVPEDAARIAAGAYFAYDKTKRTDIESALAKPWFDFKPEAPILTAFDAQAAVQGVLSKLTKAMAGGLEIQNRAHAIEAARKMLDALEAQPAVVAADDADDLGL